MNEFAVAVESENAKSPAKWGGYISRACWKRTSELTVCDKNHSVFLQLRFITNALALSTRKVRGKHFSVFILFFCPRNWWDCLKLKKRHALLMDSQFAQRAIARLFWFSYLTFILINVVVLASKHCCRLVNSNSNAQMAHPISLNSENVSFIVKTSHNLLCKMAIKIRIAFFLRWVSLRRGESK